MSGHKRILNATRSGTVCERAVLADRPLSRMRGLLGRRELPAGEGLLLTPAPAIHTAFMRFAIDAVFLDGDLRVLKIVERLRPWRAAGRRRARSVLELAAGEAARLNLKEGDQMLIVDSISTVARSSPTQVDSFGQAGSHAQADHTAEMVARRQAAKPTPAGERAAGRPMHVMVMSTDRRFREVVSLLLARRGCTVSVGGGSPISSERIDSEHPEVVVIDAGRSLATAARVAAAVESLNRPVGIVIVDDHPEPTLPRLPTLPKWGSFEDLFAAVQQAHARRLHRPGLFEQTINRAPA
jgi:uncharacterized membrane protein (UPF0127 family)